MLTHGSEVDYSREPVTCKADILFLQVVSSYVLGYEFEGVIYMEGF